MTHKLAKKNGYTLEAHTHDSQISQEKKFAQWMCLLTTHKLVKKYNV
jgi:hypothetical protein